MKELIQKTDNDELFTTSVIVAERFGKRHDRVIRKIENLDDDAFNRLKIGAVEYIDAKGEPRKMYLLNRDAFSFIAMSFTGPKADKWKLDFIEAFNKMERYIKRQLKRQANEIRQKVRREAAIEAKVMCDHLRRVREMAGKETKSFHYANEHKLINFVMTGEYTGLDREAMMDAELKILVELENENMVLIAQGKARDERRAALLARKTAVLKRLLPQNETAGRLAN